MADYHSNEIVDMIMILVESCNNYAAAARLYAEHHPNRRHLSNVTIQILTQKIRNRTLTRQRRSTSSYRIKKIAVDFAVKEICKM